MSIATADIITYNASTLYGILNNLSLMFHDANFKALIGLSITSAVAWYMVSNIQAGETAKSISQLVFATIFIGAFIGLEGNVIVHDQSLNERREVRNLPLIIPLVGGYVSQVADNLTHAYETYFQVPDDSFLNFRKYGTLFGAKLLNEASKQEIKSPRLTHNMNQFMTQCIVPDVRIKARYTLEDIMKSKNPWEIIKNKTSPLRGFEYDSGNGMPEFKVCRQGAKLLDVDLQKEAETQVQELSWRLSSKYGANKRDASVSEKTKSYMLDAIKTQLPAAHEFFTEASGKSFNILKQHMMRNYLSNMPENYAIMKGATSAAQAYGLARAKLVQQNSMFISGALSPDNLLRLYTVFQALVYGVLPIIVLLLPFYIGFNVLKMYIGVLIWVHSWPIFFAITNYIQNESLYTSLSSAAQTLVGNDPSNTITGWTIMNSPAIASANLDVSQTAGMLTASIPVISLIMVNGASQAVHVASSWFAKGEGAALDSGSRITDGNIDGGNLNMQNRTAFNDSMLHHNTKASYAGVGSNMELSSGSQLGITGQGGQVLNQTTGISQTAANYRLSDAIQETFTEQSQTALNTMQTKQAAYAESLGATTMSAYSLGTNSTLSSSSNEHYGVNDSVSFMQQYDEVQKLNQDFAKRFNMNEMQASKLLFGVNANIKAGIDTNKQIMGKAVSLTSGLSASANVGGEINETYSNDAISDKQYSEAVNFIKDNNMSEKIDSMLRASSDINYSDNSSFNDNFGSTHNNNLDELSRVSNDYQTSIQEYKSLSELVQLAKTHGASVDLNMQQFMVEKLANMQDDHGNIFGIARADAILRDEQQARPYINKILHDHQDEIAARYKSNSLSGENIEQRHAEQFNSISSQKDNLFNKHYDGAEMQLAMASKKDLPLNKNMLNQDAKDSYYDVSDNINQNLYENRQSLDEDGILHQEHIRKMRDQNQRGLIRRSFANVIDNVGTVEEHNE